MATKRVIEFQGKLDVSQLLSALNEIESKIKSSNTTDTFQKKYLTMISSLRKQSESLSKQLQSGFTNTNELNKFMDKVGQLRADFSTLSSSLSGTKVDFKDIFNISSEDTKRIQELNQQIIKVEENLRNMRKTSTIKGQMGQAPTKAEVGFSTGDLKNALAANITDVNKINELFAVGFQNLQKQSTEVEEQLINLQNIKEQYEEINTLLNKKGRVSKEDRSTIQQVTGIDTTGLNKEQIKEQVGVKVTDLNQQIALFTTAQEKVSGYVTNLENWRQQILNLSNQITQEFSLSSTSLNNMNAELTQIVSKYTNTEKMNFNNLSAGAQKAETALEGMEVAADKTEKELKSLEERSRFFDNLGAKVATIFSMNQAFELLSRALRTAWNEIKALDTEFTGIAVVTEMTTDDLWNTFDTYNKMARELGTTTQQAAETSKLFYQQGLETQEVMTLTEETIKMAKIAEMDFTTATNQMTAALRGFKLEMSDASRVNDVFSALAAEAAVDTQEVAYALTKTASIAQSAGMELESTSAFLTQMIETTREAPENIGTAMKTIIARFQEMKTAVGEVEVDGELVDVNKVDTALKTVGISLRDSAGQFRDLDDVFLELAGKWDSLDRNTQRYIATIAAGSRQQSRFIAMMDNYERTTELMEIANDSAGVSAQQFEKTLDSLETKITQLKTSFEGLYQNFVNSEMFKGVLDVITAITDRLAALPASASVVIVTITALISKQLLSAIIKAAKKSAEEFTERWRKAKQEISKEPVKIEIEEVRKSREEAIAKNEEKNNKRANKLDKQIDKKVQKGNKIADSGFDDETLKKFKKNQSQINALEAEYLAIKNKTTLADQVALAVKQEEGVLTSNKIVQDGALIAQEMGLNAATSASISIGLAKQGLDATDLIIAKQKLAANQALTLNQAKAMGIAKAEMALDRIRNALGITSVSISQMSLKAQAKEAAQKAKNTVATWANTIAQIANNAAHGDLASILLVGAAVAGGAALAATVGITIATKNETAALEANQRAAENANAAQSEYAKGKEELIDLTQKYNRLKELENQKVLTESEDEELIELQNELAETYPELVSYYDEEGNAILKSLPAIQDLIEEKKKLNEENREALRIAQEEAIIRGMYTEDTEAGERLEQLRQSATAYANATEGDAYYDVIKGMAAGVGASKKNAQDVLNQFVEGQRGFDYTLFNDIIGTSKISASDFQGIAEAIEASGATNAEEYEAAFKEALDTYASDLSAGERENAANLVKALGGYYSVGKMFEVTLTAEEDLEKQLNYDEFYQVLTESGKVGDEEAKKLSETLAEFLNLESTGIEITGEQLLEGLGSPLDLSVERAQELVDAIDEAGGIADLSNDQIDEITKKLGLNINADKIREAYGEEKVLFENITKELQNLNQNEVDELNTILSNFEDADYENINKIHTNAQNQLKTLLSDSPNLLAAINDQMDQEIENFDKKYQEVQSSISNKVDLTQVPDNYLSNLLGSLDANQLEALDSQIDTVYENAKNRAVQQGDETGEAAGKAAAQAYLDSYNQIINTSKGKNKDKIIGIIGATDFTSADSVANAMVEISDTTGLDISSAQMQEFFASIVLYSDLSRASLDETFESLQANIQETSNIMGLASESIKGTLDFEDMKTLMNASDNLSGLNFEATAEGYRLVGTGINEINLALQENQKQNYEAQIATLKMAEAQLKDEIATTQDKDKKTELNNELKEINKQMGLYSAAISAIPPIDLGTAKLQDAANSLDGLIESTSYMTDAIAEQNEYGELSWNTVSELISNYKNLMDAEGNYISMLDISSDSIKLNEEAMESLRQAQVKKTKTELENSALELEAMNTGLQAQIDAVDYQINSIDALLGMEEEQRKIEAENLLTRAKYEMAFGQTVVNEEGKAATAVVQFGETTYNTNGEVVTSNQEAGNSFRNLWTRAKNVWTNIKTSFSNIAESFKTGKWQGLTTGWIDINTGIIMDNGFEYGAENLVEDYTADDFFSAIEAGDVSDATLQGYKQKLQEQKEVLNQQMQNNKTRIEELRNLSALADKISSTQGTLGGAGSEAAEEAKEELEEYLLELEKLYNILSKISNLEKQLEELELGRKSLIHSQDLAANDAQRLSLIKELKAQNEELLRLQEQERDAIGKELQQTYGAYVKVKDGYLEVNHAMISTIRDEESGDHLEELIDEFDEYSDSIMETKEALSDYNDQQKEITDTARDYIVTLKDQLLDQVIAVHEAEIEAVKEKYDAIKTEDEKYLESLRNTLDRQRQLRDQEDQQEELDEKERRLALLSRDTSGIYAQEIEQLKQEIEDQRQTMADTETDNLLTALEEQLNAQHEALDAEVEYLENSHQEKLETMTEYWAEVEEIMKGGYTNILNYLKEHDEEFITGSKEAQEQWLEEWEKNIHEALAAIELLEGKFKDVSNPNSSATVSGSASSGNKGGGSSTTSTPKKTQPSVGETVTVESGKKIYTQASGGKALRPTYGTGPYTVLGAQSGRVKVRYSKLSRGVTGWFNISDLVGYAQGGLVDTTGPVMVHGTKNKPEAFLSSKDTENIAKFRDVLSDIFSNRFKLPQFEVSQNEKDGDVYYDIHIQVDGISGDYDVEDMWEKIKKEIVKDAQSRNVIAIKRSR